MGNEKPEHANSRADWSEVAGKGIAGMTSADKGWILAFVLIFGMFQAANYMVSMEVAKAEVSRMARLGAHLEAIEQARLQMEEHRAEEINQLHEMVSFLTQTISRSAENKSDPKRRESAQ